MHLQSFRSYPSASLLLTPQVSLTVVPFRKHQEGCHSQCLLLPSPQVSLTDAPFLQTPRMWSVSSTTCGNWVGLAQGPYLILWPLWWVDHTSSESSWGSAVWRERTLVRKRTWNTVRWCPSSFVSGFLHSSLVEPPIQRLRGLAWLASPWGLQKCSRKQQPRNWTPHLDRRESSEGVCALAEW